MSIDIFISYSRKDLEFVRKLHRNLADRDLSAWFDQDSIAGGDRWSEEIVQGINHCKVFLIVLSPDSVASRYVTKEISLADEKGKPILPLMYRHTEIPERMQLQLTGVHYILFTTGAYRENFDKLMAALNKMIQDDVVASPPEITLLPFEPETVPIPAGEFLMGSKEDEDVPDYEKPQDKIYLPGYRIGKYPVTTVQYAEFIRQTKHPYC